LELDLLEREFAAGATVESTRRREDAVDADHRIAASGLLANSDAV
jgi:hypothetical protein